jgi:cobalt-zinc-cadmium resistance protein CzcA
MTAPTPPGSFGNDLATLKKTAAKIKQVMSNVPGIADLAVLNSLGQPTVRIDIDRARATRYGLAPRRGCRPPARR